MFGEQYRNRETAIAQRDPIFPNDRAASISPAQIGNDAAQRRRDCLYRVDERNSPAISDGSSRASAQAGPLPERFAE